MKKIFRLLAMLACLALVVGVTACQVSDEFSGLGSFGSSTVSTQNSSSSVTQTDSSSSQDEGQGGAEDSSSTGSSSSSRTDYFGPNV